MMCDCMMKPGGEKSDVFSPPGFLSLRFLGALPECSNYEWHLPYATEQTKLPSWKSISNVLLAAMGSERIFFAMIVSIFR